MATDLLVPLAGRDGGALVHLLIDDKVGQDNPAKLDLAISALMDVGLYRAALQSLASSKHFRLRGQKPDLGSRAMHVANPGEIAGLTPENASSAQLGIALAFILDAAEMSGSFVIAATGVLDSGDNPANASILPVHHLQVKLEQTIRDFSQPGRSHNPDWFFLPKFDPDGASVEERYQSEIRQLESIGTKVCMIASLNDAVESLGIRQFKKSKRQIWSRRLKFLVTIICFFSVAVWIDTMEEIPLIFLSATTEDGRLLSTPLWLTTRENKQILLEPCQDQNDIAIFPPDDKLLIKFGVKKSGLIPWPIEASMIVVGDVSPIKVFPLELDNLEDAENWFQKAFTLSLTPPEEEMMVAIVAKRKLPFGESVSALLARLQEQVVASKTFAPILSVRNWLQERYPGMVTYHFRVTSESHPNQSGLGC